MNYSENSPYLIVSKKSLLLPLIFVRIVHLKPLPMQNKGAWYQTAIKVTTHVIAGLTRNPLIIKKLNWGFRVTCAAQSASKRGMTAFYLLFSYKQLNETEQFDVFCFLSDLNHLSLYAQQTKLMLNKSKRVCSNIVNFIPEKSFPRLGNTISGKMIRKYLLNEYFNIDWYSFEMELKEAEVGIPAYGLCLLTALSPRDISWMGLF